MKYALCILVLFSFAGCSPKATCKSNCYTLQISGRVVDGETDQSLSNVNFTVYWLESKEASLSTTRDVKRFTTKKDGTFNTTAIIDTTMWPAWEILWLATDEGNGGAEMMTSFNPDGFKNLTIRVYPIKKGI